MNQILDHSGPKKIKMHKNPEDTAKIIRVFACLIIIFAICFITKGVYSLVGNDVFGKKNTANEFDGPSIVLKANDDILEIEVAYNQAIEEVSYQWYRGNVSASEIATYDNSHTETTSSTEDDEEIEENETSIMKLGEFQSQKGTGETLMRFQNIGIPKGDSTIHVIVKAQGNVIREFVQSYHTDVGVDKIKPEIKIETQGSKVIATAIDETEMDYIVYSINDGAEVQIKDRLDKKTIKAEIELDKIENNNIRISAVDKGKNTSVYTQEIVIYAGKPTIEFAAESDMSKIYVTVKYAKGVSQIEYEFNGEKFEEKFDKPKKEYEFELSCVPGHNLVSVKAYTEDADVFAEDAGELDYNP